jgi:hypothetical protein
MAGPAWHGEEGGMTTADQICVFISATIGFQAAFGVCCYKWGWHRGAAHAYEDILEQMHAGKFPSFAISPDGKSISCHLCGMTSHNPNDVLHRYCGMCHVFHGDGKAGLK